MVSIFNKVIDCIDARENFVVEAGAGSGKTYTLVEALRHIIGIHSNEYAANGQQIACITFTNVAVNEIKTRIDNSPFVRVSTIHDFLWSIISRYQRELRDCITTLNASQRKDKRIDNLDLSGVRIEYWQYGRKWKEGKIHHNDVIKLSSMMFSHYPKLARLVSDGFPIIFVDEYQDTQVEVINLLIDDLTNNNAHPVIGFFGDSMQKIYGTGVGELNHQHLTVLKKEENYRCSTSVIDLLNNLRPSLRQTPSGNNSSGSARFFYTTSDDATSINRMNSYLESEGWKGTDSKILMLTRRSIAETQNWGDLMAVYQKRGNNFAVDNLMRRDDEFGETFEFIENIVSAFNESRYGDLYNMLFTAKSDSPKLSSHSDKKFFFNKLTELQELCYEGAIGPVLDFMWDNRLITKSDRIVRLEESAQSNEDLNRFLKDLRAIPYQQVAHLHQYLEEKTPFSTSHGTKGEEYDNVLVVIDDSQWNQYKFSAVLTGDEGATQYSRSLNLFYVCCSRAKNNLVVLMLDPSEASIDGARRLFGFNQVIEFPELR